MTANWRLCNKHKTKLAILFIISLGYNLNFVCSATRTKQMETEHFNILADELQHEQHTDNDVQDAINSRQKRLVWITDDGRLALPPGTTLTFTPTIALPLVRHPPEGFFSNLTISFPLTIDFDKLGLTDNQNPLGDLPPLFTRSFGHSAGEMLGNYIASYLQAQRKKRDLYEQESNQNSHYEVNDNNIKYPELPERFKHIFHGGERVLLYGIVEDFLTTFGLNGKACLLRTICEIHSRNLEHFGVFGEITKLFLTVTKSPFAQLMPEYVRAEQIGEGQQAPGECFPYHKACPKSIFKALHSKYSPDHKSDHKQPVLELERIKLPKQVNDIDTEQQNTVYM